MKTCPYSRLTPAERARPPELSLDPLVHVTLKKLNWALEKGTRKPFDQDFRHSQPGICQYLRFAIPVQSDRGNDNALAYHVAMFMWIVLNSRFGNVPAIRLKTLRATELRAGRLFGNPSTLRQLQNLPVIQFALSVVRHARPLNSRFITDEKTVLVKVLTVLLCFSAALENRKDRSQKGKRRSS